MQRLVRALWPMSIWMVVVFCMSTELGSPDNSGRLLADILHWINPALSAETFERIHFLARKACHVTEYAIFALLTLRALRILRPSVEARWSWSLAFLALGVSAAYGATDEFHQLFVPTRGPSIHDVVIDSCGAALGLFLAFLWWQRRTSEAEA